MYNSKHARIAIKVSDQGPNTSLFENDASLLDILDGTSGDGRPKSHLALSSPQPGQ